MEYIKMDDYMAYRTLPRCRMIQVLKDFKFTYKGVVYTIPGGFTYDGFSNPRLFWRILPSSYGPRVLEPGGKHDFFYRTHDIPKDEADRLLEHEIHKNGLNKAAARLAYYGVRFGGGHAWKVGPEKPLIGLWGKAAKLEECRI
jgi:hypothetical protein